MLLRDNKVFLTSFSLHAYGDGLKFKFQWKLQYVCHFLYFTTNSSTLPAVHGSDCNFLKRILSRRLTGLQNNEMTLFKSPIWSNPSAHYRSHAFTMQGIIYWATTNPLQECIRPSSNKQLSVHAGKIIADYYTLTSNVIYAIAQHERANVVCHSFGSSILKVRNQVKTECMA